jgi:hypothetical protein
LPIYRTLSWILTLTCLFSCTGCKRIIAEDITGKWVYEIDLPKKAGVEDVKQATIEFFDDKKFKATNVPIYIGDPNGKVGLFTGSGTWEIEKNCERVSLDFLEVARVERRYGSELFIDQPLLNGEITLHNRYVGYHLCFFHKTR